MAPRVSSLTVQYVWDERSKCWMVHSFGQTGRMHTIRCETTTQLDWPEQVLLTQRAADALGALLPW